MKKFLVASLIYLLPTLLMAQETATSKSTKSKTALLAMIASSGTSADKDIKAAKELRKTARETRQYSKTMKAFKRHFANASDVQWSEGKHQRTVMFTQNDIKTVAWYSKGGSLLHTMLSYDENKLPEYERDIVNEAFRNFKITHVEELHSAGVVVYLVHLEDKQSIKLVTILDGFAEIYRDYQKS